MKLKLGLKLDLKKGFLGNYTLKQANRMGDQEHPPHTQEGLGMRVTRWPLAWSQEQAH